MSKKLIVLDLICYGAIPYLIWTYSRDMLGDYLAMLLSTVPGFIYTIYRFIKERQLNITGLFIIVSLFIGTIVNLLSSNAENMLWNQVYLGYVTAAFFILTMAVKKPLGLYFAVDGAYLQGVARKDSLTLFSKKGPFQWYQLVTLLFVIRAVFQTSLKAWLINTYGVDGYGQLLIYMKMSGYVFTALIIGGYVLAYVKTKKFLETPSDKHVMEHSGEQV